MGQWRPNILAWRNACIVVVCPNEVYCCVNELEKHRAIHIACRKSLKISVQILHAIS